MDHESVEMGIKKKEENMHPKSGHLSWTTVSETVMSCKVSKSHTVKTEDSGC